MSARELAEVIKQNVRRVLVGADKPTEMLLVALVAQGHVLIQDVPGVGKTTLARALAKSIDTSFSRIQFTPDLLPSDITGAYYYNQRESQWLLREGPIFAGIVLADEINRAAPRTQSALLEAMQEGQVTIEGETRDLPSPFLVIATQNPIELEGTFPLPEAQLDRFLLRISMGYPSREDEKRVLLTHSPQSIRHIEPVTSTRQILDATEEATAVTVEESIAEYIVDLIRATREHPAVQLGGSPRAGTALLRASRALAALRGRDYVLPDDVKELAVPVLAHRLVLTQESMLRGRSAEEILQEIIEQIQVPVEAEA
ncbi:ATPase associated with various cellular activities AAA_3 [Thermobaculum terrenum ATCC BAA-798]|uniref:ATPase associated with various cellular activities AAA_3 n=1 Tax=Thermobaculum terrenum (strain ATCC BAA-798 / CCMEE 7001 / YNP1) TaxID=525904 RepID=D1CEQ9_THET1|nr:MoxR family ATPase [Thermobaculum terrenum]ACZ41415.1 ATPase associated with various cellular activities AAA_3 [Thermobaculum terrenum ATCC BAA-798]